MNHWRSTLGILICATLAACKDCNKAPKGADPAADTGVVVAGGEGAARSPVSSSSASDDAGTAGGGYGSAGRGGEDGGATATPADEDAGPSPCKLTYGPAEQPFRGPAAMVAGPTELRLIANDSGKPRVFTVPWSATTPPAPSSFVGMRWPPCEVAGKFVYCQAPGGAITRTTLGGNDTKTVVSTSKSGTRIAAAPLGGGDHAAVAFLDVRQTTEGAMLQAFIVLDQGTPQRLSEDGAGATTLRMAPRGTGAVAAYLDTRTAMVPVHARSVALRGNDLALGNDAVVFVGGAPERGIDFTLAAAPPTANAPPNAPLFILLPMPRETTEFGMATIPLPDPPKDDVPGSWSLYPNGLDPAPIGASFDGWVARVRPKEKMPGARRVLELGRLDERGGFHSLGIVSEGKAITDVDVVTDPRGGVWILYGDPHATWLERRLCP